MPLVERIFNVCGGAPVIVGTRVFAAQVVLALQRGYTYAEARRDWPGLPELTDEEVQYLMTWPIPTWEQAAGDDLKVSLDWFDGEPMISYRDDDIDVPPGDIPALIVALCAASAAHQQWEQSVAAWLTTEQRAEREGTGTT